MERIELFILRVLFVFFVIIGINTITHTIPVSSDFINIMLIGFIVSGLSMLIFPLWKVGRKLGTQNILQIMSYRRNYKIRYAAVAFGIWGLLILNTTPYALERAGVSLVFKVYGLIFVFLCVVVLFLTEFFSGKKKTKDTDIK
jgi:hypothetical protein